MENATLQKSISDPLGRYYTKNLVGRTLVREMSLENPRIVVDLGTGDGALSLEGSRIWTDAKFVTVDIDKSIPSVSSISNRNHHILDVLNSKLHTHIGLDLGSVDGAICNPPYIRPEWREDFAEILEDAGLSGIFPSIRDIGAEILFIAQNLRFLKNGGKLGLIVPDGLIAGERYGSFRELMLSNHKIERVIELPRKIFRKTDAKAHIVIITKKGQTDERIAVQRLNDSGELSGSILVPSELAIHRLDYSYLNNQYALEGPSQICISDVCETLTRGQLSSVDVRSSMVNIFHSTDFPKITENILPLVPKEFILEKNQTLLLPTTIAESGDILLCRVGRNLELKVCLLQNGYAALSDCVYKLRVNPKFREKVINFLISKNGQNQLAALAHGVGAKYLSKRDLLQLKIDI